MEVLIIVIFSKLILSEGGVGGRIRVRARTILGVNLLHINQIQIILILHFFDIYFGIFLCLFSLSVWVKVYWLPSNAFHFNFC